MDWSYQLSCFQYSKVFETGFSDFDIQTVTEFKIKFGECLYLKFEKAIALNIAWWLC